MKTGIALLLLICSAKSYSQIAFEKGYYIDNSGNRTECLVKNRDWKDNPRQFEIKASETAPETLKALGDISEIAIYNTIKFIRADVEIDRSSKSINFISTNKNPVFSKEQSLLKVLADGRFALLSYDEEGLNRFFYRKADGTIKQLVYKEYYPAATDVNPRANPNDIDYSMTRENNQYRVQLWSDVRCDKTDIAQLDRLKYDRKSLTSYVNQVNECYGPQSAEPVFTAARRPGKFYLKAALGFQQQTLKITREPSYLSSDMSESGVMFGVEAEYIFPWNNNKWSIILEPHYNKFDGEDQVGAAGPYKNTVNVKMDYLSVPIGMRHYLFLNDDSKIFFSGVIAFNFISDSEWNYDHTNRLYVLETLHDFGIGAGYDYKRYSAELRYYTPMNLHSVVESKFSRVGMTVRYRVF